MYIKINGQQYPCANYRASPGGSAVFYGVEGLTLPVVGEVVLHTDDGFELAKQDTRSYSRQVYENNTLTLTNEPEPLEAEPLPDPGPSEIEILQAKVTELETTLNTLLGV